jgi:hypothetical protein
MEGRCGAAPVITKPVPLCSVHGLDVASQVVSGVLRSAVVAARRNAPNLTAPPPVRLTQAEAYQVADEYLTKLKAQGREHFAFRDVRDVVPLTGKSRSWVYAWLDKRANEGVLVRDDRHGQAGYRFAA